MYEPKDHYEIVEIVMQDDRLTGKVHMRGYHRLSDLLNRAKRPFLAVIDEDDRLIILNKETIHYIVPQNQTTRRVEKRRERMGFVKVEIHGDGFQVIGDVSLRGFRRISDLMNDERYSFLPVIDDQGQVMIVNKSTVEYVIPLEEE
ncbi:MAG: hypothetical protein ACE5JP_10805 [Candidatus Bipolaricaulia bacterium]